MANTNNSYIINKHASLRGQYKGTTTTKTEFTEKYLFKGSDIAGDDNFGATVAIRNKKAVVSAPGWDDAEGCEGCGSEGAIYYFEKGDTWASRTETILTSSIKQNNIKIGTNYDDSTFHYRHNALSVYEKRVTAGMPLWYNGSEYPGTVLIWEKLDDVWIETNITASNAGHYDYYGAAVSTEGNNIVVGAPYEDTKNTSSGRVYILNSGSTGWVERATLDPEFGAGIWDEYGANFGACVYVTGTLLAVGAPGKDRAQIYRSGSSGWISEVILTHPSSSTGKYYGAKVAINKNTLTVGCPGDDAAGTNAGAVFIYKSSSVGGWTYHQGLTLGGDWAGRTQSYFGHAVDVHDDYMIVGAPWYSGSEAGISQGGYDGRAFLYKSGSAEWTYLANYQPIDHASSVTPQLGTSTGISDGSLIYGIVSSGTNTSGSSVIYESLESTSEFDIEPTFSKGSFAAFNIRGQTKEQNYKTVLK